MIERWCAWHLPFPIMFAHKGNGRKKHTRTHGICPKCLSRVEAQAQHYLAVTERVSEPDGPLADSSEGYKVQNEMEET